MKKLVLISTYCDNEEKKNVLKENIIKLKSLKNLDVIIISPLDLPDSIVEECDFYFKTKENPILSWPIRMYTHWYELELPNKKIITLKRGLSDYGWAGLYQVKKLSQIGLTYDYDLFYHIIYDLDIDEFVLEEFKKNESNKVYPRRDPHNPETLWETTLHFMVFDRDTMKKIVDEISLNNYLTSDGVAEGQVLKWKNKFNIPTADFPVKDKIFYWQDFDFFDYKISKKFKIFVSKNETTQVLLGEEPKYVSTLTNNLRIVFHGFQSISEIKIIVNNEEYKFKPIPWEIIEIPISSLNVESIFFVVDDELIDFSSEFEKITYNEIYYNHRP